MKRPVSIKCLRRRDTQVEQVDVAGAITRACVCVWEEVVSIDTVNYNCNVENMHVLDVEVQSGLVSIAVW